MRLQKLCCFFFSKAQSDNFLIFLTQKLIQLVPSLNPFWLTITTNKLLSFQVFLIYFLKVLSLLIKWINFDFIRKLIKNMNLLKVGQFCFFSEFKELFVRIDRKLIFNLDFISATSFDVSDKFAVGDCLFYALLGLL